MGFVFTQWVGVEGRTSRTAAWLGCWSTPGWLLDQNDGSEWCYSLRHGGAMWPPSIPLSAQGQDSTQDTRKWCPHLPIWGLDFTAGRWGSAGCSHHWQGMWMNTAEPCSVFWSFSHCCEPVQPDPESRACLGQIAPSSRQQAPLCFLSLLAAFWVLLSEWGENLLNWVLVSCY